MKTLAILVLLLALAVLGLGYSEYRQTVLISALETQVSGLQFEADVHQAALVSHKKAIVQIRKENSAIAAVLIKVLDFLDQTTVEPGKQGPSS